MLVDRISRVEARAIEGIKTFFNAPVCLGVEALAQLGASHVRHLAGFERHAFLLKINRCVLPLSEALNGGCLLYAGLICQSDSAFTYELAVEQNGQNLLKAECIFALVPYDLFFKKEILKTHYQQVFSCLKNDLSAS